jgi:Glycerophosphoryl diester phosphodiesterase
MPCTMKRRLTILSILFLHFLTLNAQTFPNYIAHGGGAGGEISWMIYSNSREAIMQSIRNGYTFIEIDMVVTSDGHLVAAHDWESFNNVTGHSELGDSAITLESFKSSLIYGELTPISIDEVVEILQQNPSVFLVTDKISDVEILDKSLSGIRNRVYVEAFSIEDFTRLREAGYHPMYSHPATNLTEEIIENLLNGKTRIDFIANSTTDNFKEISRIRCLLPIKIAMYTSNSLDFFDEHLGTDVDLIYTDYYNPMTGKIEE